MFRPPQRLERKIPPAYPNTAGRKSERVRARARDICIPARIFRLEGRTKEWQNTFTSGGTKGDAQARSRLRDAPLTI